MNEEDIKEDLALWLECYGYKPEVQRYIWTFEEGVLYLCGTTRKKVTVDSKTFITLALLDLYRVYWEQEANSQTDELKCRITGYHMALHDKVTNMMIKEGYICKVYPLLLPWLGRTLCSLGHDQSDQTEIWRDTISPQSFICQYVLRISHCGPNLCHFSHQGHYL